MGMVGRINGILGNEGFRNFLMVVARLFLAGPFVIFGVMKYINQAKMMAYVERANLPGELLYIIIPYQVLCGLAIVLGFKTRLAAFLLGGFCVVATLLYHMEWGRSGELGNFTKDFAMAGGFVLLWLYGPGKYSLDALWAKRRAA